VVVQYGLGFESFVVGWKWVMLCVLGCGWGRVDMVSLTPRQLWSCCDSPSSFQFLTREIELAPTIGDP
jgi:hypothetical protein